MTEGFPGGCVPVGLGAIVCGIAKGTTKAFRCPVCGFESDDLEDYATTMCWTCVGGTSEEPDEDDLAGGPLDDVRRTTPCRVCGEPVACAHDAEGRPLVHVEPDEDEENPDG